MLNKHLTYYDSTACYSSVTSASWISPYPYDTGLNVFIPMCIYGISKYLHALQGALVNGMRAVFAEVALLTVR